MMYGLTDLRDYEAKMVSDDTRNQLFTRPKGEQLAWLIKLLLSYQAERGGGAVTPLEEDVRRVMVIGQFDLRELAHDLETFFEP